MRRISQVLTSLIAKIDKQVRFIISTSILSLLMLVSTFYFFDKAFIFVPLIIILSYVLTYFSLLENIEKIERYMLFFLQIVFSVAFYVFFFLFPVRWLTRIPFISLYAVSIYALLGTANIFNVGVEKNLQLYRAAFSVNYFFHTVTVFILANCLFSLKFNSLINGATTFIIVLLMSSHFLWTIKLDLKLERTIVNYSVFLALVVAEVITVASFLPLESSIMALLLTALYYSLVGMTYAYLDQRFYKETIREYLLVLGFVLLITVLTFLR